MLFTMMLGSRLARASGGDAERLPRAPQGDAAPTRIGLGVRTDVPLFVGGQLYVEHGASRLRLTGAIGQLPAGYARLINGALTGGGVYDPRLGRELDLSLASGLAWNAHLGFRPFSRHGLLLEVGYGTAELVADGDVRVSLSRDTGVPIPAMPGVQTGFRLTALLHMVDARLGWEWAIADRITIHLALGLSRVMAASTTLEQYYMPAAPPRALSAIAGGLGKLDETMTKYGFIPTVGVGAGYRF